MIKIKKNILRQIGAVVIALGSLSIIVGPVHDVEAVEYYEVLVDGNSYGTYDTRKDATNVIVEARKKANEKTQDIVLTDFSYEIKTTNKKAKNVKREEITDELCQVMLDNQIEDGKKGYLVKSAGYSIVLESKEAVLSVLNQLVNVYDINDEFSVEFNDSMCDEQNMINAVVVPDKDEIIGNVKEIQFSNDVQVMQVHGVLDEIVSVDDAVAIICTEDKINVTSIQQEAYTEEYDVDAEYIYADDWYTNQKEIISEGVTGVRDVVASVTYIDGIEMCREIVYYNSITQAQPEVIKVGTKERPSFMKPLKGGSFSSGFGTRWGRKHEGIDWTCSVGTSVVASSDGTVCYAGWQNGYGNTVIIRHSDGLKTRYAHLSSILVSEGQKVSQGEKIALSGNTGRSTGPHLHFEILLDGEPVNPMNYL